MAAEETQADGSKTLVAFVVGLLIGGLLVWAFSSPNNNADQADETIDSEVTETATSTEDQAATEEEETGGENVAPSAPVLPVGEGVIEVNDQPAGMSVSLERATYPIEEGWIGVRDYNNGQLGFIKGVVRFSAAAGRVPESVILQNRTMAGQEYAVVIFSDNGDGTFNPAGDVQVDQIFATFTAQ